MIVQRIGEGEDVGAGDDEATDVEGTERDPALIVWRVGSGACQMQEPAGYVDDEVAIDFHVQLADTVHVLVRVERAEPEDVPVRRRAGDDLGRGRASGKAIIIRNGERNGVCAWRGVRMCRGYAGGGCAVAKVPCVAGDRSVRVTAQ